MCSSRHVECGLDNPSQNIPAKTQIYFVRVQIWWKKTYVQNNFSWSFACLHLDYCFHPLPYFSQKHWRNHWKSRKKHKKLYRLLLTSFSQSVDLDNCNATLPKILRQKANISAQRQKTLNQFLSHP